MVHRFFTSLALLGALLISERAVESSAGVVPEPPPVPNAPLPSREPTGTLTLRQALSLALMGNPELAAFSYEVRAAEARMIQAGALPNPELGVAVETFGGSGEISGFDAAETTVEIGQLIELGGKRGKRTRVARLERGLAGWDYEATRLDVLTRTAQAFVEVLAAQKRLELAADSQRLVERVFEVVSERVTAGKVSPVEETKAGVERAAGRIGLARAARVLEAARKTLGKSWGSATPGFTEARGDLENLGEAPDFADLAQRISGNPDLVRWEVEKALREATLGLEKARGIPDLTVSAGVQHFADVGSSAFTAGISVPLPFFDRNQGGVREARFRLAGAAEQRRAAEVALRTELSRVVLELQTAHQEATTLKAEILPAAERVFEAAREAYQQGKWDFLEVLDAQRTLFEARGRYTDALEAYHKAVADVDRLTARSLDAVPAVTEGGNP